MTSVQQQQLRLGIILTTLAVTAWLVGDGVSHWIALKVMPDSAAEAGASRVSFGGGAMASNETVYPQTTDVTPILRRNIFDSETGPQDKLPEQPTEGPFDPNAPPVPCDGGLRLVASMYYKQRPEFSYAAIASTGAALVYQMGASVDGKEILEITDQEVIMRQGARRCRIAMFGAPASAPPPAPVAVAESGADPLAMPENPDGAPGGIPSEELDKGIKENSEKDFTVSRSLLNKILDNQAELMRSARVVPQTENGRVVGARLYGIKRNGLLKRLGLQNGDLLRTINGFNMTDPRSALEAYAKLRNADHLSVAITRKGAPMTIDYAVR